MELLSRFLSPAEQRAVVQGLADGSVDVVIGTHRLLAQDVQFKMLGLLVVDEEQRFGVTHKEAVKRMAEGVDVLDAHGQPDPAHLGDGADGDQGPLHGQHAAGRPPAHPHLRGGAGSLCGQRGAAAGTPA